MYVRVVRKATLEEVQGRLRELERLYGMSFEEFERRFLNGGGDPGVYVEWSTLTHAHRAYAESGELECLLEELMELTGREFGRLLTPKRLELLAFIASHRIDSLNDLARKVGRNVKNVYGDVNALSKLGFLRLRRMGRRNVVPEALLDEIAIIF